MSKSKKIKENTDGGFFCVVINDTMICHHMRVPAISTVTKYHTLIFLYFLNFLKLVVNLNIH